MIYVRTRHSDWDTHRVMQHVNVQHALIPPPQIAKASNTPHTPAYVWNADPIKKCSHQYKMRSVFDVNTQQESLRKEAGCCGG